MSATAREVMFQRYDCVLAVEGPYTREVLSAMQGGYKSKPLPPPPYSFDLALIAKRRGPVHVFNGRAHLRQRFLGVYRANGLISEQEVNRLREGSEHQVDFCGRLSVVPTDAYAEIGASFELRLTGRGKREVNEGDVMLVEELGPDDPPCSEFTLAYSFTGNPNNLAIDFRTDLGQSLENLASRQLRNALGKLRAGGDLERGPGKEGPAT